MKKLIVSLMLLGMAGVANAGSAVNILDTRRPVKMSFWDALIESIFWMDGSLVSILD